MGAVVAIVRWRLCAAPEGRARAAGAAVAVDDAPTAKTRHARRKSGREGRHRGMSSTSSGGTRGAYALVPSGPSASAQGHRAARCAHLQRTLRRILAGRCQPAVPPSRRPCGLLPWPAGLRMGPRTSSRSSAVHLNSWYVSPSAMEAGWPPPDAMSTSTAGWMANASWKSCSSPAKAGAPVLRPPPSAEPAAARSPTASAVSARAPAVVLCARQFPPLHVVAAADHSIAAPVPRLSATVVNRRNEGRPASSQKAAESRTVPQIDYGVRAAARLRRA